MSRRPDGELFMTSATQYQWETSIGTERECLGIYYCIELFGLPAVQRMRFTWGSTEQGSSLGLPASYSPCWGGTCFHSHIYINYSNKISIKAKSQAPNGNSAQTSGCAAVPSLQADLRRKKVSLEANKVHWPSLSSNWSRWIWTWLAPLVTVIINKSSY